METLIIQPKSKDELSALKAIIKVLKIDYKSTSDLYDPVFVEKILQARDAIKMGKGVELDLKNLWK